MRRFGPALAALLYSGAAFAGTASAPLTITVGESGGGSPGIALTRTINQPTGTTTPTEAFWQVGQPFKPGEVPAGSVLSATLAGQPVRVATCNEGSGPLLHADGSWRWSRVLVDYSGQTIAPGSGATLAFSAAPGSQGASTRSNADWSTLADTVTLGNLVTSAPSATGYDQPAGIWTAAFDGGATNTVTPICSTPLGLQVEVKANFVNGSTTQVALQAVMDYWVTEKADGSLGPVASKGPFIEDMQAFKPNFANYSYDLTYLRAGATVRSMLGVQQAGMTSMVLPRTDGQWDWTADDPNAVVTQDYTLVRATKAIPPIANGITFTGGNGSFNVYPNAPITSINGDVLSTGYPASNAAAAIIYGNAPDTVPTAVDFVGSSGQTYWTCTTGTGQFSLYDTWAHAVAGIANACTPTTGQVTPPALTTGLTAELAVAPVQGGDYDWGMSSPGSREDISLLSEWGTDYLVGNTQPWQHLARVQAYTMWGIAQWVLDGTGHIPSLMDTAETPAAMLPARPISRWTDAEGEWSADINGGNGPLASTLACSNGTCTTTGTGPAPNGPVWGGRYPDGATADINGPHWPGAVSYIIWLLEGDHYLQDQIIQSGNRGIDRYNPSLRNLTVGGTTYYGNILSFCYSGTSRDCAWAQRDTGNAMFVAPEGSPEQAYFRAEQKSNVNGWLAYQASVGPAFTALGYIADDTNGSPPTYYQSNASFYHDFIDDYMGMALGWTAARDGEFVPGLSGIAANSMTVKNAVYDNNHCAYFGDLYNYGIETNDVNQTPTYGTTATLGYDFNQGGYSVVAGGNTITTGPLTAPYDSQHVSQYQIGWEFRPLDFDANGSVYTGALSPLVDGTVYYIVAGTNTTFQVSATPGGTPITFTATGSYGGQVIPTSFPDCPTTGSYWSNAGTADSYLMLGVAQLAIGAAINAPGSAQSYANAKARLSPAIPALCSEEAMWCMQSTY